MFYIVIGIVLLLLSAGTIAVMVLFEIRDRRAGNIQQGKKTPEKAVFPGVFGCCSQSL